MKLKLLHIPRYDANPFERTEGEMGRKLGPIHCIPPLGISSLTSFLRKHSVAVDQDDLLIKTFYHNLLTGDSSKQINPSLFNDESRVDRFIKRGHDPILESEGEKMLKLTKCSGFDVFGFSIYETTNPSPVGIALVLGKLLKERYGVTIVVGGEMHEEVRHKLVESPFIDCAMWGEAEAKLLNFCQKFEMGVPLEKIEGLILVDERGTLIQNPPPAEGRRVPTKPDFTGLPLDLYRPSISCEIDGTEYEYSILILPYLFVRGCPLGCAFCPDGMKGWVAKKPEEVVEDLKELSKKYRTRYFLFVNTNINPTWKYGEKMADIMLDHDVNIKWSDCATFFNLDEGLLRKFRAAGAVRLIFGLESASPRILKYVHKPLISVGQAKRVLRLAYSLGIWNELDLICGFPYETEDDVNLTIKFIRENAKYVQEWHLSKFRPDGWMKRTPEKYGIRIRRSIRSMLSKRGHSHPFDEVAGMRWEEKVLQTDRHYRKIMEVIKRVSPRFETHRLPGMSSDDLIYVHFINWWNRVDKGWNEEKKMFIPAHG
jgi:radical SAM superfamily enzyme YgiQ (UPF0313 family)